MDDLISRQAAIDALQEEIDKVIPPFDDVIGAIRCGVRLARNIVEDLPSAERLGRWIPVTERLPEEDKEVLISYRYKEGEGNTSHSKIDITSYGQMYFGGNKVGMVKHWRSPFEYFESNYEVIAWMPLPEPYKGGEEE